MASGIFSSVVQVARAVVVVVMTINPLALKSDVGQVRRLLLRLGGVVGVARHGGRGQSRRVARQLRQRLIVLRRETETQTQNNNFGH